MRKLVLWDTSPPSSQSTDFSNKICIPCPNNFSLNLLASHAASSMNLDLVTYIHNRILLNHKKVGHNLVKQQTKTTALHPWLQFQTFQFPATNSVPSSLLLEKAMATHSSTLAWKIPWTEEPGGLLSMGLHRVGHDWSILAAAAAAASLLSQQFLYLIRLFTLFKAPRNFLPHS